jgi:uncharacterized membrane protein
MSVLSDAKVLGGIGSLMVLFTAVPGIGWLMALAGFVMIVIAISEISRAVEDKKILESARLAIVFVIGAAVVAVLIGVEAAYAFFSLRPFEGMRFTMPTNVVHTHFFPFDPLTGLGLGLIGGLVAALGMAIVSAVFFRRSYSAMANKLHVNLFGTAGLLLVIGAATAVIGVGVVLLVIAELLLAISFFSIREEQAGSQWTQTSTVAPSSS